MANPGIAIQITAADGVTAVVDKINGSIGALTKRTGQAGAAAQKLGDSTGISKLTTDMRGLAGAGLDVFRTMDRVVPQFGLLTGAGTLAGMAVLTKQWADMAQQTGFTAQRIGISVERLSSLTGAAKLGGVSADSMARSLGGLGDAMVRAAGGLASPQVRGYFSLLLRDTDDLARMKPDEMLDRVADGVKRLYQNSPNDAPQLAARMLGALGISEDLLPVLKDGADGLEKLRQKSASFGTVTQQMTENARALNQSYEGLSQAVWGVANRLVNDMSPAVTASMNQASRWIAKNKETADSYAKVGIAAVAAAAAAKGGVALLTRMGLLGTLGLAYIGQELVYQGTRIGPAGDPDQERRDMEAAGIHGSFAERFPHLVTAPRGPSIGLNRHLLPDVAVGPQKIDDRMREAHDYLRAQGWTEEQTAGMVQRLREESSLNPEAFNGDGGGQGAQGIAQWRGDRLDSFRRMFGYSMRDATVPADQKFRDQLKFLHWEMTMGGERGAGRLLRGTTTAGDSYRTFTDYNERPGPRPIEDVARGAATAEQLKQQFAAVTVDINLKNAPAGTTAVASTTGNVQAPPPRIEHSMPRYGAGP